MQTSENSSSLERRIDVTVPMAQFNMEVEKRLQKLAHTVKLHGFRPGKVPLKVVARQFGDQVRQEVLESELETRFVDAIKDKSLKVAGFPRFEANKEETGSESLVYGAVFEIYPEVALGDISEAKIERPVFEVSEADVDKTLETLRKQRAVFEPVERAAESGDKVDIDFAGKIGKEAFEGGSAKGAQVVLGEGRMLADFEAAIIGMKPGETKAAKVTFPKDYHGQDVAGKKAVFDITLNRIEAPKLPELDEEFAKSLGVSGMDEVRQEIMDNLKREVKRRIQSQLKDQVMQSLLDSTKVELPRSLVEMEVHRLVDQARGDLEARGIKTKDMPIPHEMFEEQAKRRVNLGLILAELVKVHALHAKPEQVRAVIEEFAQHYEHPEEVIRWHYADASRLNDAESFALEENVVNWALGLAKVEDKAVTFEELMGSRDAAI